MKGKTILLLPPPNLVLADCTGFGNFNRFIVQDNGSIIFY